MPNFLGYNPFTAAAGNSPTYSRATPVLTNAGYVARQPAMTAEQFAAYRDNPNSYWGGLGDNRPGAYAARIAGQPAPAATPTPTTGGLGQGYWNNIQGLMGAGLGQGMSAAFGQMQQPRQTIPSFSSGLSGFMPNYGGQGYNGYAGMGQMGNWGGGMGYGGQGYGQGYSQMPNMRGGWGGGFGYGY